MKSIQLAPGLSLPVDAVTQTFAAIARKGGGKTYAAGKLAEQMSYSGAQIVVIDPVGNWFGLRLGSDGHSPGLAVYVFGGERGDLPLYPESGKQIADLVVDKRVSAILDVSNLRKGERQQFAEAFAEQFFHRKKTQRSPVHLFIEEAQKFIPQAPFPGERAMLGAFEDIVRLGRNYGIGCTLISQRPQSINKEVLSQVECLIVLQVNGVHERKAIEAWVSEHGLDRGLVGELPGLHQGEAFVWSPQWLRIFKRVRIGTKDTFDSSATPKVGEKIVKPAQLSPLDIATIQESMADTVRRAREDDPKELRRRIEELSRAAVSAKPSPAEEIVAAERRGFEKAQQDFSETLLALTKSVNAIYTEAGRIKDEILGAVSSPSPAPATHTVKALPPPVRIAPVNTKKPTGGSELSGPERRILNALAWLESIGVSQPEQTAVAFLAGYTVGGGGFNNPRGALRTKGMIEYVAGDRLALTDTGRAEAEFPDSTLTSEELQRMVFSRLPGPEQKILRVILDAWPNPISSEICADRSGYTNGGGGFNNPRGRLRTLGLIEYPSPGQLRARDILFPDRRSVA